MWIIEMATPLACKMSPCPNSNHHHPLSITRNGHHDGISIPKIEIQFFLRSTSSASKKLGSRNRERRVGWFRVIELHRLYGRHALINAARSNKLIRGLPVLFIPAESSSFFPPPIARSICFPLHSPFLFYLPPTLPPSFVFLPAALPREGLSVRPVTRATPGISHN